MSAEAVGWCFRHSPATGATFQVHVAIADSVNDQHDSEFWMRLGILAVKARVNRGTAQRAVGWLLERGLLELADGETRAGSSRSVRYRFLFPDLPVIYDARSRTSPDQGARSARGGRAPRATEVAQEARPNKPNAEPKEEPNRKASSADDAPPDVVAMLCGVLADAIEQQRHGEGRPRITEKWRRDMRLLVERGPLRDDSPRPVPEERVVAAVKVVFTALAERDGNGFCWADQIRSPHALRDHWHQLRDAARRAQRSRVGKSAQAVDRVAAALGGADGVAAAASVRPPLGLLTGGQP